MQKKWQRERLIRPRLIRPRLIAVVGRNGAGKTELLARVARPKQPVVNTYDWRLKHIDEALSGAAAGLLVWDSFGACLHPLSKLRAVDLIRRRLEQATGLYVILATHSPDVVNAMKAWEVQVVARDRHGSPVARWLCDHPDYAESADYLNAGEFWSVVGEDWVLELEG